MRNTLLVLFGFLAFSLGDISSARADIATDNEVLLRQLDEAVANKSIYQNARKQRADSLHASALAKKGYDRIQDLQQAYETYNRYLSDSVFAILNEIKKCPEYSGDSILQVWVALSEARNYGVMGYYATAFDILEEYDPQDYDRELQLHYYNTIHAVSGWMADFAAKSAPDLAEGMVQKATQYYDSIYVLETDPFSRTLISCNQMYDRGDYQMCIDTLLEAKKTCHPGAAIYLYALLAQAYQKLGDMDTSTHYLILTSIHDMQEGVAEYMALPILAERMHDLGDIDRAYSYLTCSLEDANTCHSSLRAIEATYVFPIIDAAHRKAEKMRESYQRTIWIAGTAVVLLILLGFCIYYYERHRRVVLMIDQEKKHVKEVTFIAEHDELTSLYNRRGGKRIIAKAISSHRPGYLCILDIDLFKHVNDTFGHDVGDKVLKAVAEQLASLKDQVAVRLGGDEFCSYCTAKITDEEFRKRISKFFEAIEAIRIPEMGDEQISVSMGAIYYDGKQSESFDNLFREADQRLYKSKQTKGCHLTL